MTNRLNCASFFLLTSWQAIHAKINEVFAFGWSRHHTDLDILEKLYPLEWSQNPENKI